MCTTTQLGLNNCSCLSFYCCLLLELLLSSYPDLCLLLLQFLGVLKLSCVYRILYCTTVHFVVVVVIVAVVFVVVAAVAVTVTLVG